MVRRSKLLCALGLGVSWTSSACRSPEPAKHPVVEMAQYDLDCPREAIEYDQTSERTIGASGCGRETKYIRHCQPMRHGYTEECTWVEDD